MHYVYMLRSIKDSNKFYVGYTQNLEQRFNAHNASDSRHTARYKPWELLTYVVFTNKEKAMNFEQYLKTGSGRAFAKKHF